MNYTIDIMLKYVILIVSKREERVIMLNKSVKKAKNLYKLYNFIIDTIIICIGLFISSFGTALFYQSGMGSGGMATFCDGLHLLFNVSYGIMYIVVNVIFLILLFIFDKTMINVGTLMCAFIIRNIC